MQLFRNTPKPTKPTLLVLAAVAAALFLSCLIFVRTRGEHNRVVIEVNNTGCGIPDDVRARVFDPFFTTQDVGKGTGQGLAVDVSAGDLQKGMVLFEDVLSGNGDMLIRKGRRLTWPIIERLRGSRTPSEGRRPIRIRQSSVHKPEALLHG